MSNILVTRDFWESYMKFKHGVGYFCPTSCILRNVDEIIPPRVWWVLIVTDRKLVDLLFSRTLPQRDGRRYFKNVIIFYWELTLVTFNGLEGETLLQNFVNDLKEKGYEAEIEYGY